MVGLPAVAGRETTMLNAGSTALELPSLTLMRMFG